MESDRDRKNVNFIRFVLTTCFWSCAIQRNYRYNQTRRPSETNNVKLMEHITVQVFKEKMIQHDYLFT